MSIVGPRPIRPAFFEELCEQIPQYWQRLVVEPGMTGFAQLRMTRETSWAEKLAHDLEYIADRSVRSTCASVAATAWRILSSPFRALAALLRTPASAARCAASAACCRSTASPSTRASSQAMNETLVHRGPRQRGRVRRGLGRARRAAPVDHRPRGSATSRSATRTAASRSSRTARSTTTASCASGSSAPATSSATQRRHRGARAPLRGARARLRRGPARHVRDRAVGPARAPARARPRPLRHQAALLPRSRTARCRSHRS